MIFLFPKNKLSEKEMKNAIPLKKKKNYQKTKQKTPYRNLTKRAKDLYSKHYKTLMEKSEEDAEIEKYLIFHKLKEYYLNGHITQSNLQIQCNFDQNQNEKPILEFI